MNKLVIIAGLPRSGTSWLGKIFDSHPNTAYRAEADSGKQLDEVPVFPCTDTTTSKIITDFATSLPNFNRYSVTGKPPVFNKSYRSAPSNLMFAATAFAARYGNQLNLNIPVFGARIGKTDPQATIVWKTIRSVGRCELIMRSLPEAKFVHLMRHPCGHIASILRGEAEKKFPVDTDKYYGIFRQLLETPHAQKYPINLNILKKLTPEQRLAWRWLLVNEKALNESADYHTRTSLVRYEDICADPVNVTSKLFDFAELKWNAQTEAFLTHSTSIQKDRYFTVFKNPHRSANRWRKELPAKSIDRIMAVVSQSKQLSKLYPYDL